MRGPTLLYVVCFLLLAVPSAAPQAASQSALNDLLLMQMNWDALKSNDNARPAVRLKFVPYETHQQDGKTFTSYHVYAAGLPQNKEYVLFLWQIGWGTEMPAVQPVMKAYVNTRGLLLCAQPIGKQVDADADAIDNDSLVDVIVAGAPGEPVRYALYDQATKSTAAMGTLIVHPIEQRDAACRLQAIRAVGGAEIVLVEGTGFAPNAALEITTETAGKPQSAKFTADDTGRLETAVILLRKDLLQGDAKITMKSPSCAPSVSFPWGAKTYQVK